MHNGSDVSNSNSEISVCHTALILSNLIDLSCVRFKLQNRLHTSHRCLNYSLLGLSTEYNSLFLSCIVKVCVTVMETFLHLCWE